MRIVSSGSFSFDKVMSMFMSEEIPGNVCQGIGELIEKFFDDGIYYTVNFL